MNDQTMNHPAIIYSSRAETPDRDGVLVQFGAVTVFDDGRSIVTIGGPNYGIYAQIHLDAPELAKLADILASAKLAADGCHFVPTSLDRR